MNGPENVRRTSDLDLGEHTQHTRVMQQITLRIEEDTIESLEGEASDRDVSRSEYLRDVIESRTNVDELQAKHEAEVERMRTKHKQEVDELRDEIQSLEAKRDDLQSQLIAANQRIDTTNELVKHVSETKTLETKKASAGIVKRAKWWLVGMDNDD